MTQMTIRLARLIVTPKMNDIDPQAWLADVLSRIADHPAHRLEELLPWDWKKARVRRRVLAFAHGITVGDIIRSSSTHRAKLKNFATVPHHSHKVEFSGT